MQKISELLNIEIKEGKPLKIYHPEFKDEWVYYENSDEYWCKWGYNDKGKVIYFENSYGFWRKHEYNDEGQEIYYESSSGYWEKHKYNEEGQRIYFETSNGVIEDNRTKKLTVKELEGILGYKLEIISEGE